MTRRDVQKHSSKTKQTPQPLDDEIFAKMAHVNEAIRAGELVMSVSALMETSCGVLAWTKSGSKFRIFHLGQSKPLIECDLQTRLQAYSEIEALKAAAVKKTRAALGLDEK